MPAAARYAKQRERKTPPHVTLAALRGATGLTIDGVIDRMKRDFPHIKTTRGAISAIEQGHRGASDQMLRALCAAYGLPEGAITTDYVPRAREVAA